MTLDDQLLAAHAADDKTALVALYAAAADATDDIDAMCFFLTHAYVFALETGDIAVDALHARLKEYLRV